MAKIGKFDIAFHRTIYTCETCTHVVCGCTDETTLAFCVKRIGTFFVSKIDESDKVCGRVQKDGLGDAGSDYVDLALYRTKERPEDTSDS